MLNRALRVERTKASEQRDALLRVAADSPVLGLDKQRKIAAARVRGLAHVGSSRAT